MAMINENLLHCINALSIWMQNRLADVIIKYFVLYTCFININAKCECVINSDYKEENILSTNPHGEFCAWLYIKIKMRNETKSNYFKMICPKISKKEIT